MYTVYVLQSLSTGKTYTGCTNDLETRLKYHNDLLPRTKKSYTYKQKGPWVVIYTEKCNDKKTAYKREKELKSGKGREYIKKHILRL